MSMDQSMDQSNPGQALSTTPAGIIHATPLGRHAELETRLCPLAIASKGRNRQVGVPRGNKVLVYLYVCAKYAMRVGVGAPV